jgi:hypothetical protein
VGKALRQTAFGNRNTVAPLTAPPDITIVRAMYGPFAICGICREIIG